MSGAKILLDYVMRRYCPHDIVQKDYAQAFTNAHCNYLHGAYDDPCAVCWDKFITELLRDEAEE